MIKLTKTKYQYLQQNDVGKSIRRFAGDESRGQRWDTKRRAWVDECCERRACEITKDTELPEVVALEQTR